MNSDFDGRSQQSGNHPSYAWTQAPRIKPGAIQDPPTFEAAMRNPAYPLASAYDPGWTFQNSMGPICTWFAEALAARLDLKPGQRILDLGCGSAITSIFLAREFDLEVWAVDLWIDPDENRQRIEEAGLSDRVFPLHAEARRLPFARDFFDGIVSIDAYHYFGTEVRYLSYLSQFVKPGGPIGIVVPGNSVDPGECDAIPLDPGSAQYIGADWYTFRSPAWWRRHWSGTRCVDVESAEMVDGSRDSWLRFVEATKAYNEKAADPHFDEVLMSQAGQSLGFCSVIARRNREPSLMFGPGIFMNRIA